MDDTAQNTTQNIKQNTQNLTQGDDSAIQVQSQQQQPQQPVYPVGSVAKEHGPLRQAQGELSTIDVQEEYIQPSGAEAKAEVSVELQEYGVEAIEEQERPNLTKDHKAVGIEHAKESVPAPTQVTTSSHVQLPMTEEEALQTIKTTGASDSKHWLAMLVEKMYEKMRFVHSNLKSTT